GSAQRSRIGAAQVDPARSDMPVCIPDPACGAVLSLGPHPAPCRAERCPPARPAPFVCKFPDEPGRLALRGAGLLGHASARMAQRYAHLAPQTLLDAAEVVSGLVCGPRPAPGEAVPHRAAAPGL